MARILVVDDQDTIRHFITRALEQEGHIVTPVPSGERAMEVFVEDPPDAVVLDLKLPGMNGLEVLQKIKKAEEQTVVIMITAYGEISSAVKAMKAGAYDYISKPVDLDHLIMSLNRALESKKLWTEVAHWRRKELLRFDLDFVVGTSKVMQDLMAMVENVARSNNTTVLIEGESGTGKELIANMVHHLSPRKDEPFMEINCASLPEQLLESELFGHERGAFTDAKVQKQGLFELSDRGTVFLDEVGEMSLTIQVKLLRVMERMTFKRVGGTRDIKVDLRIISATNRDLAKAVREGTFREDLYYRLKVVPLIVPPLRDRREDIEILAKHFLNQYNKSFSKEFRGISGEALRRMQNYAWPGNVRELKNVIERAVLLFQGEELQLEHLSLGEVISRGGHGILEEVERVLAAGIPDQGIDFDKIICDIEAELISRALVESGYNQSLAARLLGISRDKLRYKMKGLELTAGVKESGESG
jgi:two-component system response regulator AtoC